MSVARTCRRVRIKMKNDRRYRKKDPVASARRMQQAIERQKAMASRKGSKK